MSSRRTARARQGTIRSDAHRSTRKTGSRQQPQSQMEIRWADRGGLANSLPKPLHRCFCPATRLEREGEHQIRVDSEARPAVLTARSCTPRCPVSTSWLSSRYGRLSWSFRLRFNTLIPDLSMVLCQPTNIPRQVLLCHQDNRSHRCLATRLSIPSLPA